MPKKQIKHTPYNVYFGIVIFLITGFGFMLFNDFGLVNLFHLYQKEKKLFSEVNILMVQQDNLRKEIKKLQTDEEYIKHIAREKFMMVLPGEKVYRVQDEKIISN